MNDGSSTVVTCMVDTDIVIDHLRGREYARRLLRLWATEGPVAVSAITHLEVYKGMRPWEEDATRGFLDGFVTMSVDVPTARKAGTLIGSLRPQGITVGIADAAVAATAMGLGVPLLTNNVGHYPFPGLEVNRGLGPR